MDPGKSNNSTRKPHSRTALDITIIYFLIAVVWIAVSGKIASVLSPSQDILEHVELYKGIGFVLVTSILLYTLIRGSIRALELREARILRLNRIHTMLSSINSAILRIRDRQELLEEACKIVSEGEIYQAVGFRIINMSDMSIETVASGGVYSEYLKITNVSISEQSPYGHGPTGTALREGKAVVVNDTTFDPHIEPWQVEVAKYDIKSAAALPLLVDDKIIGALSLYSQETYAFDEEEMYLLNEIVADTSHGLEYIDHEQQLNYLHYYDTITGLPNREIMEDHLSQAISRYGYHSERLTAVIALSIENFRRITDSSGIQAGDLVLREVASQIKDMLRPGDLVAKIGAHDFGILLVDMATDRDISMVSHKLLSAMPQIIHVNNVDVTPVYRLGIAVHPRDSNDKDELIRYAGRALSAAREQKTTLHYFSKDMEARFEKLRLIENKLQTALDNNELKVFYQPVIEVETRSIKLAEALLRWQNPELGSVSPVDFIPVAEETGLIIPVGYWTFNQVCRQLKSWKNNDLDIHVTVNVSPQQLQYRDFAKNIISFLELNEIDMSRYKISIEITESLLIESIDNVLPVISILKEGGLNICVDDFGTGYSSLSYLMKLPVDTLKIDREFISSLPHMKESFTLVKGVIGMAKGLGLKVVAEGVETEEQFSTLRELECDYVQGYLFSKPVPADELYRSYGP